jgi:uncharacterized membrane protein
MNQPFRHIDHKFIDSLSDGVFSIALTLLGLNVVALVPGITHSKNINSALIDQWPTFFAYLLGFIVLFSTWYSYHATVQYVEGTDAWTVWQHGITMAWVALMPFGVAFLAESLNTSNRKWGIFYFGVCLFGNYWTSLILFAVRRFRWKLTFNDTLPISPEQMLLATKLFFGVNALLGSILVPLSLKFPWLALVGYGIFVASNIAPVAILNTMRARLAK